MPAEARRAQGGPGRCLILGLLRQVQKSQVGQDWKGAARGRQEGILKVVSGRPPSNHVHCTHTPMAMRPSPRDTQPRGWRYRKNV